MVSPGSVVSGTERLGLDSLSKAWVYWSVRAGAPFYLTHSDSLLGLHRSTVTEREITNHFAPFFAWRAPKPRVTARVGRSVCIRHGLVVLCGPFSGWVRHGRVQNEDSKSNRYRRFRSYK